MCGSVQTTVWKKTCILLAWKTHVRIGWKYSKTCDEGTPLYPGQSVPTWQVPSSQVCPNNMKTPYFKMIIPYFIHFSFNSYHAYTYTHPTSYRFMQFDNKVWEWNRHKIAFEIKEITYNSLHHYLGWKKSLIFWHAADYCLSLVSCRMFRTLLDDSRRSCIWWLSCSPKPITCYI